MDKSLYQINVKSALRNLHVSTILFAFLLAVFIGYSVFVARNMQGGIPDEITHTGLSKHFATAWLIPPDAPQTYRFGNIGHKPFIYYWINGRVINGLSLFYGQPSDYKVRTVLRLLNVFYAVLALLFLYALSKELIKNRWWQLLPVFFLTNTLMFVFLAGGINYDNLTNLCAFAGIYYLARVFTGKPIIPNSIAWMIWIGLGALVKVTVLPLAVVMAITWVVYIVLHRRDINFHLDRTWKTAGLLVVLVIIVIANASIYAYNLVRYRALMPSCMQVLTAEQCNQNPLVRREDRVILSEPVTYQDIIQNAYPDPVEWALDFWIPWMQTGIYGFLGNKIYLPGLILTFYRLLLFWIIAIAVRFWKRVSYAGSALIAVLLFYTAVLLQTNYNSELSTGFKHLGIQGRYIFPVIGIGYTLIAWCLSAIPNRILARVTAAFSVILFLWGGPITSSFIQAPAMLPANAIAGQEIIAEITGDMKAAEEFTSSCEGTITQFSLVLSTYNRQNTHPVLIQLVDAGTEQVIAHQQVDGKAVENGTLHTMPIEPLSGTFGHQYRLEVTSPESVSGDAVGVWSSSSDVFPGGHAVLNGKDTGKDLAFQYRCVQSPFAGWFR